MKGSRLTDAAVLLVAAVGAVQLVVASLRRRVTHGPAGVVARRHRSLPCQPARKLVGTTAPAALLVLPGLRAVPLPVAVLLLSETPTGCSLAATLPRGAVAPHVEGSFEPRAKGETLYLVQQRHQTGVGLHSDFLEIGGVGDL